MPTTITSIIGDAPSDYTTIALWEDATDNTSLVSADEVRVGALKNQTHTLSSAVAITGATVDSTRYRVLKCDAGASFRDHANVQTNALRYNPSNGAAIAFTGDYDHAIQPGENYVRLEGLQISAHGGNQSGAILSASLSTGIRIDFCIVEGKRSSSVLQMDTVNLIITNSLIVQRLSGAQRIADFSFVTGAPRIVHTTFVVPSDLTKATNAVDCLGAAVKTFANCMFFGATNVNAAGSIDCDSCLSDDSTPPDGCTTVTYANQFQNTADATRDFRLKSGADAIDGGQTESTDGAVDIAKTTRPSGIAYDVGCWEFVQAGGGAGIRGSHFYRHIAGTGG